MLSLLLLSLAPACTGLELGAAEDSYGHPRALLADCAQSYDNGYEVLYDSQGYRSRIGHPEDQAFIEFETTLDALGRPALIRSWFSYEGERSEEERPVWEADYLEDSWRLAQLHTMTEREGEPVILEYSWSRSALQIRDVRELEREGDRLCPQFVQLGAGLRPALTQTFCDGELQEERAYTWGQGRLLNEGAPGEGGGKAHYSYNADGRLAEIQVDQGEGQPWGVADHTFTWDCPGS